MKAKKLRPPPWVKKEQGVDELIDGLVGDEVTPLQAATSGGNGESVGEECGVLVGPFLADGAAVDETTRGDIGGELVEVTADELTKDFMRPVVAAFEAAGITPEYLASKLKKELDAKKVRLFFDQRTGKVITSDKLTAWDVRQKARQDAHKILGHYPAERTEVSGPDGGFIPLGVALSKETLQVISEIESAILGKVTEDRRSGQ